MKLKFQMIVIFMESPKCIIILGKEIFVCDLLSRSFGATTSTRCSFPEKKSSEHTLTYTISFCPPINRHTQAFI